MRLVFSSDLHGNLGFYDRLLKLAVEEQASAAIVGGDLLPHAVTLATAIEHQRRFVERDLPPLLRAFRAAHPTIGVYLIPGNDDWAAAIGALDALAAEGLLRMIQHDPAQLAPDLWLNGSGLIGLTPFAIKDYERRDTPDAPPVRFAQAFRSDSGTITPIDPADLLALPPLSDALDALAQQSDPARTIYVLHCPPWETRLDRRTGGAPTGSRAVRQFIERYRPPLTLHGHIHESPAISGAWIEQIGPTVAINPGQAQRGFHAVTLDTDHLPGSARHTIYGPA